MKLDCYMPVRLVSGEECVIKNAALFAAAGKRCMIVTGGSSARSSGALNDVCNALDSQGICYSLFDEISANPLLSACRRAGEQARKENTDFIVGIGGGSPLDASKAVAIFAANPDYSDGDIYKREIPAKALPLFLVGTTSGTGSEVTGVSVLTRDSTGTKQSISGVDCYASVSFLDSRYTCSMPYSVTVSTALDALAHSVEGWFSPKFSELAGAYAQLALPLVFNGLHKLYKTGKLPDARGREALYLGSIYAGLQLNICGAAFPHTVGYVLSEDYDIPHGRACTAFMPLLIKRAGMFCPDRLNSLFSLLETDEASFLEVVVSLTDVNVKIPEDKVREYCKRWSNTSKNFVNSPGGFTPEDAYESLISLGNK